jgi:dihydroorotate dehydrogenase electron transfer subunit
MSAEVLPFRPPLRSVDHSGLSEAPTTGGCAVLDRPGPSQPQQRLCRVIRQEAIGDDLYELWIDAPSWQHAVPGQFVHVRVETGLLRRPFSVAATADGVLAIVYRRHGAGTAWLSTVQPGDDLDVLGIMGRGFAPPGPDDRILAVAGGVGIAPLAFYAERHRLANMAIVAGFRSLGQVAGFGRAMRAGVPVLVATLDGSVGRHGLVTDGLKDMVLHQHITRILTCGPTPMMQAVAAIAAECGIPCQVSVERPMGCGIGVCLGCALPVKQGHGSVAYVRSCVEGPVFDAETLPW